MSLQSSEANTLINRPYGQETRNNNFLVSNLFGYFFLTTTKSAHSIKIYLIVITVLHATQVSSFFSKEGNVSNENDRYVVYLKLCLLSLSHKIIIFCQKALEKLMKLARYYDSFILFFLPDLIHTFGSQGI